MEFASLVAILREFTGNYETVLSEMEKKILEMNRCDFLRIIPQIGIIPEWIPHDSTAEKLFTKIADIILARAFREIGLSAEVYQTRSNTADVVGKSLFHGYTLVADAKTFRLSRSAKNQKDFKIKALSDWRGGCDFAILVCPYFQYPKRNSQIYKQALETNVCLFSWEQIHLLLQENYRESLEKTLAPVWNVSRILSSQIVLSQSKEREPLRKAEKEVFCNIVPISWEKWQETLWQQRQFLQIRGSEEILYWQSKISEIKNYTRQEAIAKLLEMSKIKQKIMVIQRHITSIGEMK